MPLGGLLAGVGGSIASGLIGNAASSGDTAAAKALQLQALQGLQGVNAPTAAQLQVALQQYQNTGKITPDMEALVSQGNSELSKISTDPRLAQAQMQSLAKLQSLSNGGLQPQDAAALDTIQRQAENTAHAQSQSILQNMQERGQGGSGSELAARLAGAQGAANTQSQAGLQLGANAANRSLQTTQQAGTLGGQMQAQSFNQQAQQYAGQDAINRFNAMNSQQVTGQNTAAQNQAQVYNQNQAQQVANLNTGVANQQAQLNSQAQQTAYQDQIGKGLAVAGGADTLAGTDLKNAANTQTQYANAGKAINEGGAAYGDYQGDQNDANVSAYAKFMEAMNGSPSTPPTS